MYLMYVDESGDPGLVGSPTSIFALTGLVIHELRWRDAMTEIVEFRRKMRDKFGLKMREEIHSSPFINKPGELVRIKRNDRLTILRHYIDVIAHLPDISLISVVVDKTGKPEDYDSHEKGWQALLQRFDNTISHRNFPGPSAQDERGMIIVDGDQSGRLVKLVRRMRHYNYVPSRYGEARNLPTRSIVEDPVFRDSRHSMLIQAADVAAYFLFQQETPNSYMRKSGGKAYFRRLEPIFNKMAARNDHQGIVRL
jgi:hypothetical protein